MKQVKVITYWNKSGAGKHFFEQKMWFGLFLGDWKKRKKSLDPPPPPKIGHHLWTIPYLKSYFSKVFVSRFQNFLVILYQSGETQIWSLINVLGAFHLGLMPIITTVPREIFHWHGLILRYKKLFPYKPGPMPILF